MLFPSCVFAFLALTVPVKSSRSSNPFPGPGNASYEYVGTLCATLLHCYTKWDTLLT